MPRFRRVKLLEDEARVLEREPEVLASELERLRSQFLTAEQRGRMGAQGEPPSPP